MLNTLISVLGTIALCCVGVLSISAMMRVHQMAKDTSAMVALLRRNLDQAKDFELVYGKGGNEHGTRTEER